MKIFKFLKMKSTKVKEMKSFKIKNGRWIIGNLYDALVADKFDQFINQHRTIEFLQLRCSKCLNLRRFNYQFKDKRA